MTADVYEGPRPFPTTSWSLVALAGRNDDQQTREALEQLLTRYLPALRAHLVYTKRLTPDQADDVIQEFVARKVLERDLIARADAQRGKFRTFLLAALDRFLLNCIREANARKRSSGEGSESLGERTELLSVGSEPSRAYELAWARGVLQEAVMRMQTQCEATNRTDVWGVFQARILNPILQSREPADYRELVERFGFRSPSHASNVLMTAKRMYERVLRVVIGEYADGPQEIDNEIKELHRILASSCHMDRMRGHQQ